MTAKMKAILMRTKIVGRVGISPATLESRYEREVEVDVWHALYVNYIRLHN